MFSEFEWTAFFFAFTGLNDRSTGLLYWLQYGAKAGKSFQVQYISPLSYTDQHIGRSQSHECSQVHHNSINLEANPDPFSLISSD